MKPRQAISLTHSEEVTLRRVAHGQSDVARLCADDLVRLRALHLIGGSAPAPRLTTEGQRRFEQLAKPIALVSLDAERELTDLVGRLKKRQR